ncbi:hypothetical protein SAMN05216518_11715 [Bacteroidales bacterium KHT7]|nr:hypothetical protein SAMN05216518_11715 [Bacteroidales bacterium KHT7]
MTRGLYYPTKICKLLLQSSEKIYTKDDAIDR